MEKILLQVQQSLTNIEQQDSVRLAEFKRNKANKEALLIALKKEIAEALEQQQQLTQTNAGLRSEQAQLATELAEQSVELDALFGVARNAALDFSKGNQQSLNNAQLGRRAELLQFSTLETVPKLQDLKNLWFVLLQDMVANAGIKRYSTKIVDDAGVSLSNQVTQLGPFIAVDEQGRYLSFNPSTEQLQVVAQQPAKLAEQAKQLTAVSLSESDDNQQSLVSVTVDPQRGELLLQATQVPTLEQRVDQGGIVGYVLIGLGALGLLIAAWRFLYLGWVALQVKSQLKSKHSPRLNNPLGRMLSALQGVENVQRAELLIDKALLQEVPRLERCNSLVKLLAAIAPLLGLLGTVTGMIETFQSITVLGTSDPKLMAGGISQALITTVMGLCVAIPLLFAHSYISAKSKALLETIQQQSLLLLSEFFADSVTQLNSAQPKLADVNPDLTDVAQVAAIDQRKSASLV